MAFGAGLFADDFGVRGRGYQTHELGPVEEKINFVVFGSYAEFLNFLTVHYLLAHGIHSDGAGGHLLRNQHGEALLAFLVPIVEAREKRVLVIKIVVEDHHQRGSESEFLREGLGAFEVELDGGGDAGEAYRSGSFFGALRGPFIAHRHAVRVQDERSRDVRISLGRLKLGAAVSGPIAAIRRDGEFFFTDLLAADEGLKR